MHLPPQPPRRERNAQETQRRILDAAGAEFAAKGFDGARLGNIARHAGVQQALIHHYFEDKAHLYAEVLRLGLEAMTKGVWELLDQMGISSKTRAKERLTPGDIRILAEIFIDMLFDFYSSNGVFLAIVSHESHTNGELARRALTDNVRPLFDAIVARIEELGAQGEVRSDVDARNLVLSCVAMVAFAFQQESFVTALWPVAIKEPAFIHHRKSVLVQMILDHLLR